MARLALGACLEAGLAVPGDVVKAMFVCRRRADMLFRATGRSIREHIEDARFERVKSLLRSSGKTSAEIAAECGFASDTYLSRVFRRREGTTIRDWRQGD